MSWIRAGVLLVGVAACVVGPNNGATVDGVVVGASFNYVGYTDKPNDLVVLEVLDPVTADPTVNTNWQQFGSAVSSATPTNLNDPTPLYQWSVQAVPVSSQKEAARRWALGGVVQTRARRSNGSVMLTFDEVTVQDCVWTRFAAGESWQTIGPACGGVTTKSSNRVSGVTALASTARTPLDLPATEKPDWLGLKGDISAAETLAYYSAWGAPATLTAFRSTYGFSAGDTTATFYNNGDLGLGREMHCRINNFGSVKVIPCYVVNYSGVAPTATTNGAVFGDAQGGTDHVLDDAVNHRNSFATVAMVYKETTLPSGAVTSEVNFIAYNAAGNPITNAQLDTTNRHSSIPNACLSCHGITSRYDTASRTIIDRTPISGSPAAKFLPFDPFSYVYSGVTGYRQIDQAASFRDLNEIVRQTRPAPATIDLINGMYATGSASDAYVPTGWANADSSQDGNAMYKGVVKPGCRMCHASSTDPNLDFLQLKDFANQPYQVRRLVCAKTAGGFRGHAMPQAEHVSKVFWKTGGRALVLGYTQAHQAPPGSAPVYPDPNASCDP